MIKIIAIAVAVPVAAVLIYAATRPDSFRVQRTASIKAPPEKIETTAERDQAVKVFGIVEGGKQTLTRLEQHVTQTS